MAQIMKSLQVNIIGMGILGVVIVLLAIVLIKMKDTASCLGSYSTYNVTNCVNPSNTSQSVALGSNAGVLDSIVSAVQTPISYFALIVLVIVFVFLLGFLIKKLSNAGGKGGNQTD